MSEAAVPGGLRGRLGSAAMLSDDRLARRAVKGDERAFAAIFGRYHQDLFRYCLAIVGNPADAQDALQNTMVKVLRALPGEGRQIELKPWLYRIAHNESIELLRRGRPTEKLDPELATRGGSLAEDADARERLRRLIADLEQLPDRQRGALVMRELGGLDFEEIATALGTSPGTARQTLYEARQSLRQMDEGREMSCDTVARALSDADGRVTRRRDLRAHLRTCSDCRRFREEIEGRRSDLGALAPLPAVAATGLLQGLIGGGSASAGAAAGAGAGTGLAGVAAGGAAKSLGAGAAFKSAAAVAAVAAVGVGAADRTGVVDATPWGGGSPAQQRSGGDGTGEAGGGAGAGDTQAGGARSPAATAPAPSAEDDASTGKSAGRSENAGRGAGNGKADGERGSSGGHPSGRGHPKQQHPEAASHGQQTAAAHKGGGKGAGQGAGGGGKNGTPEQAKSAQPTKPSKQTTPPKPSSPKPSPAKPTQPVQTVPSEGAVTAPPKAPSGPGAVPQPSPSPRADEVKAAPDLPDPAHQP